MSKKILILDDEKDLVDILRDLFEMEGFEVFSAKEGKKGLAIFHEQNLDIIMTDMMMPGMNGLQFIRSIRSGTYNKDVPIILFTSMVSLRNYKDDGWQIFIKKPSNIDIILGAVNTLLKT
jgi:DNA-binding response OmpR family regulator